MRELVWLQEEPANMGAWDFVRPVLEQAVAARGVPVHYIGRPPKWHPNRMIARLQSWNYYRRDMREVAA